MYTKLDSWKILDTLQIVDTRMKQNIKQYCTCFHISCKMFCCIISIYLSILIPLGQGAVFTYRCCPGPIALEAYGAAAKMWPKYFGSYNPTGEKHNGGEIYKNRFGRLLYVHDGGKWSANTVLNERGVLRGDVWQPIHHFKMDNEDDLSLPLIVHDMKPRFFTYWILLIVCDRYNPEVRLRGPLSRWQD